MREKEEEKEREGAWFGVQFSGGKASNLWMTWRGGGGRFSDGS